MTSPQESRRRFAPVPIETTFQSSRKSPHGPCPELTPSPSPTESAPPQNQNHNQQQKQTDSHPPRERRRFAPQLIESSRRTRRVGDPGPTTRPTDKTDITPYTKHIYAAKSRFRRKPGDAQEEIRWPQPPTRRETEEEHVQEYLLELAAKEAERQIQEAALDFFPNSRAREGGIAHFYFRDSSDSDGSPEATPPVGESEAQRVRRKSSEIDLGWWQKHMQEHVEHLEHVEHVEHVEHAAREPQPADDSMVVDSGSFVRTDSDLDRMDLPGPPDAMWTTNKRAAPDDRRDSMASSGLYIQPSKHRDHRPVHAGSDVSMRDAPPTSAPIKPQQIAEVAQKLNDPSSKPFSAFGLKIDDTKAAQLRKAASPPMLGKDLTFRQCPSPKMTKLEPEHPYYQYHIEERTRDVSEQSGLWRGYCYKSDTNNGYTVPSQLHGPDMLATPLPSATPRDSYFQFDTPTISEEPSSIAPPRDGHAQGSHMLTGLEDQLRREKALLDREDKIAHEFDDVFVTQVYNYLSLGYPATARAYDEELCKISHLPLGDLQKDDEKQMAKGYIIEMEMTAASEGKSCPRWRALRKYISEWARQHPNLDDMDHLAWGVRERRGSWAI